LIFTCIKYRGIFRNKQIVKSTIFSQCFAEPFSGKPPAAGKNKIQFQVSAMKAIIRKFRKKDVEEILPVIMQYREHHHKIVVDESIVTSTREVLMSMIEHKDSFVYVAEDNGKIVGYMVIHYCPFPLLGSNEIYVTDLVILPEYRSKGIGNALIQKAVETGHEMKCKRLMLNNNKSAESYIRQFYHKCKFDERTGFANFVYNLE